MDNKEGKKKFIEAAEEARKSLFKILLAYDDISDSDNENTSENYPFTWSFDEWICDYDKWLQTLKDNFFPDEKEYSPTITVKELKELLNRINDDIQVVVRDEKNDWWLNITSIELPDEDNGSFTLTFHTKNNFDTRQF